MHSESIANRMHRHHTKQLSPVTYQTGSMVLQTMAPMYRDVLVREELFMVACTQLLT